MYQRIGLVVLLLSASRLYGAEPATPENRYSEFCAGCHGAELSTAFSAARTRTDEELARAIREGVPALGMPAFGRMFSDNEIRSLASVIHATLAAPAASMVGRTIEAETLRPDRSAGYGITEANAELKYVGYVDRGSHLCYEGIDLTGIRSIEFRYAKGDGEPPRRFAILAAEEGDPSRSVHVNLGEKITRLTGGWETFRIERVGLSTQLSGRHLLCIMGLEGGGVFNLDNFVLSDRPGENDGVTQSFDVQPQLMSAGGHRFTLEKIAEAPGELWSMEFLSKELIAATQKSGTLWLFENGKRLGIVEGTPKVRFKGQGGLLTVKAHPQYASNGWLYLTYADPSPNGAMTRIVRGRLKGLLWTQEQTIYAAPASFYSNTGEHFGGRLVFSGEYLYFGIGDRGQRQFAQDPSYPYGKIHRLLADGRIPGDNPFVEVRGAQPSVWSYGHRNPQGLAVHPQTGELWISEHGPRGGDEINRVRKGLNYGWPIVTFGINYDGTPISDVTQKQGVEPPQHQWTPSIGVSAIHFYTGAAFPKWNNQLLVGSLAKQQLRLVHIASGNVTQDEVLFQDIGRIRDITVGPGGHPYVVLNLPNGRIYRLVPVKER